MVSLLRLIRSALALTILCTVFLVALLSFWIEATSIPTNLGGVVWAISQWTPSFLSERLQQQSWTVLERNYDLTNHEPPLDIPTFSPNDHEDPLAMLEATYGKDWQTRPLLLKGLWNATALENPQRRLSLQGLLREDLRVPFFQDARIDGALTPDNEAPIGQIVDAIHRGLPYKIGSQFLLQKYPDLLPEVAPLDLVSTLFGDRFSQDRLLGHTNLWGLLLGPLTVPVFVANGETTDTVEPTVSKPIDVAMNNEGKDNTCDSSNSAESSTSPPTCVESNAKMSSHPLTGLHCEPIGNVAVQISGARQWTLIDPKYSQLLRPMGSPDGRGYFASASASFSHVPRYEVRTLPGDAIWIPTWTWHRVDYVSDESAKSSVSIGASLFHFRPLDFFRRNPLYAVLILPSLVGELIGTRMQ